ncbi:MAG: type II toxin-antitoxin system HicA family toxin [Euryarchaeota archaeon]|nr:type II toxin-antitoxin system HicA family toxin [Euryarchaeota archaeon]
MFEKCGCVFVRQRGNHLVFHHKDAKKAVVIPKYGEVPVTIIRNNMKTVGMTRDE